MIEWIASGFVFEKCFFNGRDLWKQCFSLYQISDQIFASLKVGDF